MKYLRHMSELERLNQENHRVVMQNVEICKENERLWKVLEKIEKEPPSEMAFSLMRGIARIEIGRRRRQN